MAFEKCLYAKHDATLIISGYFTKARNKCNETMEGNQKQLDRLTISDPPPFKRDEEIVNNILPSYEMFRATISKTLRPSNEDYRIEPPMYEMTPVNSGNNTPLCLSAVVSPTEEQFGEYFPEIDNEFNEENIKIWEDTILANVHNIPNLAKVDNPVSHHLNIQTFVTKEVCQKGIKPEIIDPTLYEFKQGDFIHGYVTFVNTSDTPISFEMVYVVFEGLIVTLENNHGYIDTERRRTTFKFLNMLDLFASWSFSNINRLVTDDGDPYDWCEGETDPLDNTVLAMDLQRLFMPGVTYKRYFTFRIPEKLLDDTCEFHDISSHTQVPPSFGVPRFSIPPSQLLANKDYQIQDLALVDSSISYSVSARVIGKASDYKYYTPKDQYVVANEDGKFIRVVPKVNPLLDYNQSLVNQESELFFKAFVDSIKEKINLGQELIRLPSDRRGDFIALTPTSSRSSRSTKTRQLYDLADCAIKDSLKKVSKRENENAYQYLGAYKKKFLTGSFKTLGIISLSTPKQEYRIDYVPPPKFQTRNNYNTTIKIPMDLSYFVEGDSRIVPEVKSIHSELIALTLRTQKHYIPINITHDLCFSDQEIDTKKKDAATFDTIVITQFRDYLKDITHLVKKIGNDLIKLETQMFRDIKSLATMSSKYKHLVINDSNIQIVSKSDTGHGVYNKLNSMPWKQEKIDDKRILYSKKFDLQLDLKDYHIKGSEKLNEQVTLVPSFQTCIMARLYYTRIIMKLTNGDSLFLHVPIIIENE